MGVLAPPTAPNAHCDRSRRAASAPFQNSASVPRFFHLQTITMRKGCAGTCLSLRMVEEEEDKRWGITPMVNTKISGLGLRHASLPLSLLPRVRSDVERLG